MTLNEYQSNALTTSLMPKGSNEAIHEAIFGLVEEAGEVAGKAKRVLRDGKTFEEYGSALKDELGDTLWYLSVLSFRLGFTLEEVALRNREKLQDRMVRNKISGEGDNR